MFISSNQAVSSFMDSYRLYTAMYLTKKGIKKQLIGAMDDKEAKQKALISGGDSLLLNISAQGKQTVIV